MLTQKQYQLLLYINKTLKETGCCPSFDEMREAVGLKSKSGIHALIAALEDRGFLRKLPHKARALEVVKLPKIKPVVERAAFKGPAFSSTEETTFQRHVTNTPEVGAENIGILWE